MHITCLNTNTKLSIAGTTNPLLIIGIFLLPTEYIWQQNILVSLSFLISQRLLHKQEGKI